jgi:hypothetical protein|tara:strand:+ start:1200 stop:1817 length:618 start_codon:yes stop_codon:yes gene_type:complete
MSIIITNTTTDLIKTQMAYLEKHGLSPYRTINNKLQLKDPVNLETFARILLAYSHQALDFDPSLMNDGDRYLDSIARRAISEGIVRLVTSERTNSDPFRSFEKRARRCTRLLDDWGRERDRYALFWRHEKTHKLEAAIFVPKQMHVSARMVGLRNRENDRIRGSKDSQARKDRHNEGTKELRLRLEDQETSPSEGSGDPNLTLPA